jgi:hypothetical protein
MNRAFSAGGLALHEIPEALPQAAYERRAFGAKQTRRRDSSRGLLPAFALDGLRRGERISDFPVVSEREILYPEKTLKHRSANVVTI